MKSKMLLIALLAFSVSAYASDKKVTTEVITSTEVKSVDNKPAPIELKATDSKSEGKSCDTKSGKCCSTEKKAKKVKKS